MRDRQGKQPEPALTDTTSRRPDAGKTLAPELIGNPRQTRIPASPRRPAAASPQELDKVKKIADLNDLFADLAADLGGNVVSRDANVPVELDILLRTATQYVQHHQETLQKWKTVTREALAGWFADAVESRADTDTEQVCLYLLYRIQGHDHKTAAKNCRFGPLYLELGDETERQKMIQELKECGMSGSALTFPKSESEIPGIRDRQLGKGAVNKVYQVHQFNGAHAWKPFILEAHPSPVALSCGISKRNYFPVESHMLCVKFAEGLADVDGSHRSMGRAEVVIINNEPGLLMEIAPGKNNRLGTHIYRQKVQKGSQQYLTLRKVKDQLKDPKIYSAQCKLMNVTGISWENDELYLTGPSPLLGNPVRKELFDNPDFLEAMCDLQLLAYLVGHCDVHTGNIFMDDDGVLTLVDGDDAGCIKEYADILAGADEAARHNLYFMPPPIKWISARAARRLLSGQFDKIANAALSDLENSRYPKAQLDACRQRIQQVKTGLLQNTIRVVENKEDWLKIDFGGPADSLVGRTKAIAT